MRALVLIIPALIIIATVSYWLLLSKRPRRGQLLAPHARIPEPVRDLPKVPPAPKQIEALKEQDYDWLAPQVDLYRSKNDGD